MYLCTKKGINLPVYYEPFVTIIFKTTYFHILVTVPEYFGKVLAIARSKLLVVLMPFLHISMVFSIRESMLKFGLPYFFFASKYPFTSAGTAIDLGP